MQVQILHLPPAREVVTPRSLCTLKNCGNARADEFLLVPWEFSGLLVFIRKMKGNSDMHEQYVLIKVNGDGLSRANLEERLKEILSQSMFACDAEVLEGAVHELHCTQLITRDIPKEYLEEMRNSIKIGIAHRLAQELLDSGNIEFREYECFNGLTIHASFHFVGKKKGGGE